ncbi:MAG: hypothetical protein ABI583_09255 [Betaproteobacteria bacterium]
MKSAFQLNEQAQNSAPLLNWTNTPVPRFLVVELSTRLLPGSFEYPLDHLIDHELDLCNFDTRYQNDKASASA